MNILPQAVLLGSWLGLLHACDADHLATLGGLAARDSARSSTSHALRWAAGHSAALGVFAVAVLGLGFTRTLDVGRHAEWLVVLALLILGARVLVTARRTLGSSRVPCAAVREHASDAGPAHLHFLAPWHTHTRGHASLFMGVVHGGAGSAAVLAVLPLTQLTTAGARALYLACFSLGVTAGAVAFAQLFGLLAKHTARTSERSAAALQTAVGIAALVSGGVLLFQALHVGG